jgi:hypothetical protein
VPEKPLVYVHGAGAQKPIQQFKDECDRLLFGRPMPSTRAAYYSDVRWPPTARAAAPIGGRLPAGPATPSKATRERQVKAAASPTNSASVAAAELVAARLATGPGRAPSGAARGTGRAARRPGPAAAGAADARRLAEQLFRRADRVAARSPSPAPTRAGPVAFLGDIGFPDPIFRFVVGRFASDVIDYLYGEFAEAMRVPVRQALLSGPPPNVIVCHSLGTIITYDVLSEPAFANFDVQLLVTLGSPLGIANVQDRLRGGAGRPNPVPKAVKAWSNFADSWDPVALDRTLRDEFTPPPNLARDELVNNTVQDNHDLTGYLQIPVIRTTVAAAIGA